MTLDAWLLLIQIGLGMVNAGFSTDTGRLKYGKQFSTDTGRLKYGKQFSTDTDRHKYGKCRVFY